MSERSDVAPQSLPTGPTISGPVPGPALVRRPPGAAAAAIERWEPKGELGQGGMGRVVLVRDRLLQRDIAIKEPTSEAERERNRREAIVTARAEHPGIVAVYDAGVRPDGQPWFAMRAIRGRSLAEILADGPSPAERRRLLPPLHAACQAVAYAHSQGIVHCDLKPANIMIGAFGETQVIDWGGAIAPDLPPLDGIHIGTAGAMSPEQARGEEIDARSDVFSLGAMLYEVLGGRPLYLGTGRAQVLAAARAGVVPRLHKSKHLPADLVAVVARALAPDRVDRYRNAGELAADLGRHLAGEPVSARRYGPLDHLASLARRFRLALAVAAVALGVITVVALVSRARLESERDTSEANLALGLVLESRRLLGQGAEGESEVLARHAGEKLAEEAERGSPAAVRALAEVRGLEWRLAHAAPQREVLAELPCDATQIAGQRVLCPTPRSLRVAEGGKVLFERAIDHDGAVFLDGGRLVAVLTGGTIVRLDAASGEPIGEPETGFLGKRRIEPAHDAALVWDVRRVAKITASGTTGIPLACGVDGHFTVTLARDGHRFAMTCNDGSLAIGDLTGEATVRVPAGLNVPPRGPPSSAELIGDDRILIAQADGSLVLVDLREPVNVRRVETGAGYLGAVRVAPDGREAIVLGARGGPRVFALPDLVGLGRLPDSPVRTATYDDSGRIVAAGARLERWDFRGVPARTFDYPHGITGVSFSRDGRLAVGHGAELDVLDVRSGRKLASHAWQENIVKALAFDPHGILIANGMGTSEVRRFGGSGTLQPLFNPSARLKRIAPLADGSAAALQFGPGLLHLALGRAPTTYDVDTSLDLAASPDGRHLIVLTVAHRLLCADDLHAGGSFRSCGEDFGARVLALADNGDLLTGGAGELRLWRDGQPIEAHRSPGGDVTAVALGHTGVIAMGTSDGGLYLFHEGLADPIAITFEHEARIAALAFDPAGEALVAGSWDGHLSWLALDSSALASSAQAEARWGRSLEELLAAKLGPSR